MTTCELGLPQGSESRHKFQKEAHRSSKPQLTFYTWKRSKSKSFDPSTLHLHHPYVDLSWIKAFQMMQGNVVIIQTEITYGLSINLIDQYQAPVSLGKLPCPCQMRPPHKQSHWRIFSVKTSDKLHLSM